MLKGKIGGIGVDVERDTHRHSVLHGRGRVAGRALRDQSSPNQTPTAGGRLSIKVRGGGGGHGTV